MDSLAQRKQPVFFIEHDLLLRAIHTVRYKYPDDTNAWGTHTHRDLLNFVGRMFDESPYKVMGRQGGDSLLPMSELSRYIETTRTQKMSGYANNAFVYLMDLIRRWGGTGMRTGLYFEDGRTIVSPLYRKPLDIYDFVIIDKDQLFSNDKRTY